MKMKTLDPRFIHIGFVRFGDFYHATNEQSLMRWREFLALTANSTITIPRKHKTVWAMLAKERGFQLHFFEKGLGR
jgi:hypothetical protein